MKIGLGSDHNAFALKESLKQYLIEAGHEVKDYGCYSEESVDYPDVAKNVAEGILKEEVAKGILCCGTGIGMAIAANKIKGIRAAQVHDVYSAERAELSNNAHIITIGSKVVGDALAKKLVSVFLKEHFVESPSSRKIEKIMEFER